jgi:hypothetical protein
MDGMRVDRLRFTPVAEPEGAADDAGRRESAGGDVR